MQEGSVIVDLAAEMGGNCKLTEADKVIIRHGVTIIGYTDLPSRLATQSSQLYATNLRHLLTDLTPKKDGQIFINMEDEIIRGATVIKRRGNNLAATRPSDLSCPGPAGHSTSFRKSGTEKKAPMGTAVDPGHWRHCDDWDRRCCSSRLHVAPYCFRARLFCRLYGYLERDSIVTHATDERNQCNQFNHYHWRSFTDFLPTTVLSSFLPPSQFS